MLAELLVSTVLTVVALDVHAPRDAESCTWAAEHREAAVEALLPLGRDVELPAESEWVVSVRVRPPFRPEGSMEISKPWDGAVIVTMNSVQGTPIGEQLARLHHKRRTAPLAQLLGDVRIRKERRRVDECRGLQLLVEALGRLSLTAILTSDLQMDATLYEVVSRTRTNSLKISIAGSTTPPLDTWLRQVERLIESGCTAE